MKTKAVLAIVLVAATAGFAAIYASGHKPSGNIKMQPDQIPLSDLKEIPASRWQALAGKRIYFGHKSVGTEILAGLADIRRQMPQIELHTASGDPGSLQGKPGLADSSIGANFDPASKIRDFAAKLEAAGPGAVDIALMKFCYVDIDRNTAVTDVFTQYRNTLSALQQKFPGTTFVHCTVPLTSRHNSLKAYAKRILRRAQDSAADNRAREDFNALIRAEYSGKQPLLDIAAVESTLPDGTKTTYGGLPSLAACYTYDGGHLNETGRMAVAAEFLRVLAGLVP
jgi:hypothetical protein